MVLPYFRLRVRRARHPPPGPPTPGIWRRRKAPESRMLPKGARPVRGPAPGSSLQARHLEVWPGRWVHAPSWSGAPAWSGCRKPGEPWPRG